MSENAQPPVDAVDPLAGAPLAGRLRRLVAVLVDGLIALIAAIPIPVSYTHLTLPTIYSV